MDARGPAIDGGGDGAWKDAAVGDETESGRLLQPWEEELYAGSCERFGHVRCLSLYQGKRNEPVGHCIVRVRQATSFWTVHRALEVRETAMEVRWGAQEQMKAWGKGGSGQATGRKVMSRWRGKRRKTATRLGRGRRLQSEEHTREVDDACGGGSNEPL